MRVCAACRRIVRADASQCPEDGAAAELVHTLPAGTRLGAYRIERVLGDGGMGFVYEATHEVLNRRSAIKMLRPELAKLDQIVTRFLNEAKAVNLIDHQHIVNVYDYGDGDGQSGGVYFVMEYLEGETLDDLMHKRQPMPVALLVHVFGQMVRALAAAHAKQIVHRDLKPANVFVVAREGNPYFIKLLDFGIAQLRGEGAVQGLTLAGTVMGTPQYMSPEQISGETVDARTDVWAIGVMMYRAATGHAPFKGEQFAELADKIYNGTPTPAEQLAPMPLALARLIASCLERSIEARCPSAAALLAGLEGVKRECGLDDDAILAAARADVGVAAVGLPGPREPTRESLAGSLPRYHGVPDAVARLVAAQGVGPAPRRSRLRLYVTLGAVLGGLGSAGLVLSGRGVAATPPPVDGSRSGSAPGPGPERILPPAPAPTRAQQLDEAFRARDLAKVRALAEQELQGTLASGTLQQQGFVLDALAQTRVRAGAKLLYAALKKSPEIRVRAARALADLELPESAQKLRDALAVSGDRLKVELAAALYRLGGEDARAILRRALSDPGLRLGAALAMAEAGDEAGRAVLAEHLELPAGHESWRRAAGGLALLGDARARALLQGELSQPDTARAVDAAERLARAGDADARGMLARLVEDEDFERRGEAAVALARLGDRRALAWVAQGLASRDVDERKRALASCGALAAEAAPHHEAIVKLAAGDPDAWVRLTAAAVLLGL